jgi:hypothetical protein
MRAQVHTLEAFVASLLLIASVVFALQVTAVTPLSASTASEHVENQQQRLAGGVLDVAVHNDSLKPTLLYWNESNGTFYGATRDGFYVSGGPPTPLGSLLERSLSERRIAYNLNVEYVTARGALREENVVHMGSPSDTVAAVSRTVTLYDDDVIYDASGAPTGLTLENSSTFYAPDAAPNSSVYNVVRVEVIVWRL